MVHYQIVKVLVKGLHIYISMRNIKIIRAGDRDHPYLLGPTE
jgi:hypothetical protein